MKEIIKYLRTTNYYTQDDVAKKLGISRQSYIKYENGTVAPSDKMVGQLAELYGVDKTFIYANKIPELKGAQYVIHNLENLFVDEAMPVYSTSAVKTEVVENQIMGNKGVETDADVYFDGKQIIFLNPDLKLEKGARYKLVPVESDEEKAQREKAVNYLDEMIEKNKGRFIFEEDDPYYKKAIARAKDEKYGRTY